VALKMARGRRNCSTTRCCADFVVHVPGRAVGCQGVVPRCPRRRNYTAQKPRGLILSSHFPFFSAGIVFFPKV